jgi:small subunit ribosomal protein S14e
MAPKKAPAAAKENVSLGPLAGDGTLTLEILHVRPDQSNRQSN